MQDFLTMKGLQAPRSLFYDVAYRFDIGPWVVGHPLLETLPLDKFSRGIKKVALAILRLWFHQVEHYKANREQGCAR